jgi:MFS family permease
MASELLLTKIPSQSTYMHASSLGNPTAGNSASPSKPSNSAKAQQRLPINKSIYVPPEEDVQAAQQVQVAAQAQSAKEVQPAQTVQSWDKTPNLRPKPKMANARIRPPQDPPEARGIKGLRERFTGSRDKTGSSREKTTGSRDKTTGSREKSTTQSRHLAGESRRPLPAKWHTLAATWLGLFFDGMDATIYVMVLVPALSELLRTQSQVEVGGTGAIILACFMVGWAVGAAVFGVMSDYIGRARTLTITILTYALFTGLCAFAQNWQELAFFRFLVGCGIGGEVGIGGVLLSECWKGRSRLYAVSFMVSAFGFGYLATSLLNLCLGQFGWRLLFLVGVLPAVLTFYLRAHLKESKEFESLREAKLRAEAKPRHKRSREEHALLRFPFLDLFSPENRYKSIMVIAMASSAIMGYWAVLAWIPAWVNQLTGTAAVAERSATTICMNVGLISACFAGGALVAKFGRTNCYRYGSLASFLCCAVMFTTIKSFGPLLLIMAFATGFCTIMPFVVLFIYVPELFESRIRGTAFGFSYNIGRIFAACAALTGGQLIAAFDGSYASAAATVSAVYVLGVAASFFMPKSSGRIKSTFVASAVTVHSAAS